MGADNEEIAIEAFIGEKVRKRRKMLGYSQTKLAQGLGLSFQQIQKYERGVNRISASRLFKIAEFLGVSVDYFLPNSKIVGSNNDWSLAFVQNSLESEKKLK